MYCNLSESIESQRKIRLKSDTQRNSELQKHDTQQELTRFIAISRSSLPAPTSPLGQIIRSCPAIEITALQHSFLPGPHVSPPHRLKSRPEPSQSLLDLFQ